MLKRYANGLKRGWQRVDFQPLVEWLVLEVIKPLAKLSIMFSPERGEYKRGDKALMAFE